MSGGHTASARVCLAAAAHAGRGLVHLHPSLARAVGAAEGDVVAIERGAAGVPATTEPRVVAQRSGFGQPGDIGVSLAHGGNGSRQSHSAATRAVVAAYARVALDSSQAPAAVAIDGLLRRAAGAGLGEEVTLRVVPAAQALAVRVERSSAGGPSRSSELAELLTGIAVAAGSLLQPTRGHMLRVVTTTPDGPAIVDGHTVVQVEDGKGVFTDTGVWYEDVGGLETELARVREIVELPLLRPALFARLGVTPPKGVLLHGEPGTGKTLLARAVANECRASFSHINGPDLMHKFYGESEQRLKQLFEDAAAQAPSIIFIDEVDAIAPKRAEVLGEVEKRVVAQFLALMDGFVGRGQVVVIGATNLPHALDPALRRPGRFDREIEIGQPDRQARLDILRIHTRSMPLAAEVDLGGLADRTPGFVGADLEALCQEAGMAAIRRLTIGGIPYSSTRPEGEGTETIVAGDFVEAFHGVAPTAAREIVREQSTLTFGDVGGHDAVKRSLRTIFRRPGLARGVLLEGPSGVGKSLLARGVAGEMKLPLIAVDGPLLYSKWLGESEKALADIFDKARHNAPCVLLLDQLEAVGDSAQQQTQRMVGQLLRELDDLAAFPEVAVLAATNRKELIDAAVLRRFDFVFHLALPDDAGREAIARIHGAATSPKLMELTAGMTGAEIASAIRRARLLAIDREEELTIQNLEEALCSTTR